MQSRDSDLISSVNGMANCCSLLFNCTTCWIFLNNSTAETCLFLLDTAAIVWEDVEFSYSD